MNETTEHIFPTIGRNVEDYECPVLTGMAREEVVRCPDCGKSRFGELEHGGRAYCDAFHGWYACGDGFCHLAERKEARDEVER